jgi:hypothetical protein
MTRAEFFCYLLGYPSSQELGLELAAVCTRREETRKLRRRAARGEHDAPR